MKQESITQPKNNNMDKQYQKYYCYHSNLLLRDSKRILMIFLMSLTGLFGVHFQDQEPGSFSTTFFQQP